MKNLTHHTGKLEVVKRLRNSHYGNPRFLLRIDGWTCRTKVDSSVAYEVPNHEGKTVSAIIGTHYGVATLHNLWRKA